MESEQDVYLTSGATDTSGGAARYDHDLAERGDQEGLPSSHPQDPSTSESVAAAAENSAALSSVAQRDGPVCEGRTAPRANPATHKLHISWEPVDFDIASEARQIDHGRPLAEGKTNSGSQVQGPEAGSASREPWRASAPMSPGVQSPDPSLRGKGPKWKLASGSYEGSIAQATLPAATSAPQPVPVVVVDKGGSFAIGDRLKAFGSFIRRWSSELSRGSTPKASFDQNSVRDSSEHNPHSYARMPSDWGMRDASARLSGSTVSSAATSLHPTHGVSLSVAELRARGRARGTGSLDTAARPSGATRDSASLSLGYASSRVSAESSAALALARISPSRQRLDPHGALSTHWLREEDTSPTTSDVSSHSGGDKGSPRSEDRLQGEARVLRAAQALHAGAAVRVASAPEITPAPPAVPAASASRAITTPPPSPPTPKSALVAALAADGPAEPDAAGRNHLVSFVSVHSNPADAATYEARTASRDQLVGSAQSSVGGPQYRPWLGGVARGGADSVSSADTHAPNTSDATRSAFVLSMDEWIDEEARRASGTLPGTSGWTGPLPSRADVSAAAAATGAAGTLWSHAAAPLELPARDMRPMLDWPPSAAGAAGHGAPHVVSRGRLMAMDEASRDALPMISEDVKGEKGSQSSGHVLGSRDGPDFEQTSSHDNQQVFSFHDTMRTLIHPLEPTPETEPSHFFALDPVAGSAAAHMGDSSLVDFSVTSNVLRNLGAYDTLIDQVFDAFVGDDTESQELRRLSGRVISAPPSDLYKLDTPSRYHSRNRSWTGEPPTSAGTAATSAGARPHTPGAAAGAILSTYNNVTSLVLARLRDGSAAGASPIVSTTAADYRRLSGRVYTGGDDMSPGTSPDELGPQLAHGLEEYSVTSNVLRNFESAYGPRGEIEPEGVYFDNNVHGGRRVSPLRHMAGRREGLLRGSTPPPIMHGRRHVVHMSLDNNALAGGDLPAGLGFNALVYTPVVSALIGARRGVGVTARQRPSWTKPAAAAAAAAATSPSNLEIYEPSFHPTGVPPVSVSARTGSMASAQGGPAAVGTVRTSVGTAHGAEDEDEFYSCPSSPVHSSGAQAQSHAQLSVDAHVAAVEHDTVDSSMDVDMSNEGATGAAFHRALVGDYVRLLYELGVLPATTDPTLPSPTGQASRLPTNFAPRGAMTGPPANVTEQRLSAAGAPHTGAFPLVPVIIHGRGSQGQEWMDGHTGMLNTDDDEYSDEDGMDTPRGGNRHMVRTVMTDMPHEVLARLTGRTDPSGAAAAGVAAHGAPPPLSLRRLRGRVMPSGSGMFAPYAASASATSAGVVSAPSSAASIASSDAAGAEWSVDQSVGYERLSGRILPSESVLGASTSARWRQAYAQSTRSSGGLASDTSDGAAGVVQQSVSGLSGRPLRRLHGRVQPSASDNALGVAAADNSAVNNSQRLYHRLTGRVMPSDSYALQVDLGHIVQLPQPGDATPGSAVSGALPHLAGVTAAAEPTYAARSTAGAAVVDTDTGAFMAHLHGQLRAALMRRAPVQETLAELLAMSDRLRVASGTPPGPTRQSSPQSPLHSQSPSPPESTMFDFSLHKLLQSDIEELPNRLAAALAPFAPGLRGGLSPRPAPASRNPSPPGAAPVLPSRLSPHGRPPRAEATAAAQQPGARARSPSPRAAAAAAIAPVPGRAERRSRVQLPTAKSVPRNMPNTSNDGITHSGPLQHLSGKLPSPRVMRSASFNLFVRDLSALSQRLQARIDPAKTPPVSRGTDVPDRRPSPPPRSTSPLPAVADPSPVLSSAGDSGSVDEESAWLDGVLTQLLLLDLEGLPERLMRQRSTGSGVSPTAVAAGVLVAGSGAAAAGAVPVPPAAQAVAAAGLAEPGVPSAPAGLGLQTTGSYTERLTGLLLAAEHDICALADVLKRTGTPLPQDLQGGLVCNPSSGTLFSGQSNVIDNRAYYHRLSGRVLPSRTGSRSNVVSRFASGTSAAAAPATRAARRGASVTGGTLRTRLSHPLGSPTGAGASPTGAGAGGRVDVRRAAVSADELVVHSGDLFGRVRARPWSPEPGAEAVPDDSGEYLNMQRRLTPLRAHE